MCLVNHCVQMVRPLYWGSVCSALLCTWVWFGSNSVHSSILSAQTVCVIKAVTYLIFYIVGSELAVNVTKINTEDNIGDTNIDISQTEAEKTTNTITKDDEIDEAEKNKTLVAEYKLEVDTLKYEIAKLKEELSKKA